MADLRKLQIEMREQRVLLDELNEWSAEIDDTIRKIKVRLDILEGKPANEEIPDEDEEDFDDGDEDDDIDTEEDLDDE